MVFNEFWAELYILHSTILMEVDNLLKRNLQTYEHKAIQYN